MIIFAVRLLEPPPGWRNFSGKLNVKIEARSLSNARAFCIGAAAALEAGLPVGIELTGDPPCASGKVYHSLIGHWHDGRRGNADSVTIGRAPDALQTILATFGRDRIKLQLLFVDCPKENGTEPEICFQVLLRAE